MHEVDRIDFLYGVVSYRSTIKFVWIMLVQFVCVMKDFILSLTLLLSACGDTVCCLNILRCAPRMCSLCTPHRVASCTACFVIMTIYDVE